MKFKEKNQIITNAMLPVVVKHKRLGNTLALIVAAPDS
jgi:hypothetical protein